MSNFNEYFRSTGAKMMVDRFISYGVDIYNPDYKITSVDFEVLPDDPYPSSYYIENLLTANHVVKITYTLNDDPEPLYCTFEVPREIDGLFIIEGAYRISTNKLGTDYDCRIKMSGSGEHKINFDFNRVYDIESKTLKIKRFNQTLGINESPGDITYAELPAALENPEKKEFLELTDKQSKKLMIKLDLDFKPEYITQDIIDRCLAFGDDRVRDLIVDKKIDSVISNFMHYLFKGETNYGHNFYSTKKQIRHYFTKENKLQETLNPINTLCQRFFKKGSSELQIPPGVNAVNLDSFKSKVLIDQSVAYNTTMADLIDIADTPINNNTNIQNSLTVSTHLSADGSGVLFDVYTKDFQKITIDYLDYLNSKVVDSECVDYKTKTLKPDANGKVKVKYRMKRAEFPVEEIDLIDLHPDYRLSATTRRIPFVNYTDSVRISMGSSMLKQSIPLPNAERPLVDTGNYDDLETNTLNEPFRYDEGGVVKEINNDDVIIQLNNKEKSLVKMARRTAIQSLNDVAVFTEPKVKVGQKVSKGDIILGAVEIDKDTVKSGVNSLVLFHAYKGLVNEDAVVISESYADRIASYSIIDISMDIKTSQALKWIAPVGTRVKSKDAVVTAYKAIRLDAVNQMMNEKLGSFVKDESGKDITDYTVETYLHVPNNIDDAIVSDVMVQENVDPVIPKTVKTPDYTFAKSSKAVIEKYEKEKDRKIIFDKYPEYVAADTLDPINLDNKAYNVVYTVRVRLIKYNRAQVAEKITSRYGGKGVVSKIVADEMMPIINGKRVEVILNPYSTINRKIPSVIYETSLGQICHELHDRVEKYKTTATGRKKIMPMINKFYGDRYKNMSVEDFIELHNKSKLEDVYGFRVGCFSDLTPSTIEGWMTDLGLATQGKVMMPETDLTDMEELKSILSPEEYEKAVKKMSGKFIEVEKPLMWGYMTMERLYHQPQYSNKVTSDMRDTRGHDPIAGRGRYRKEGQKIGEMELSALLARNAKSFIYEFRKDTEQEQNQRFLDNLLGIGLMVVDDKGFGQGGSQLKESMTRMKTKYRPKK